ncbi:TRAP transporter substrate-binding protein [Formosa sp. PL04]|uniref:TRAP transporter substrate-binding protein n=1 Tax=Formosa sp. PL04 TaxID=3081755 RepID=UPI0029827C6D|nr:TRAP transporter substrate-binding protein [Formosa sp. PL04]MDW5291043.1 TRAP transporter substrate-binding protein [Formosa sp. PL04]
MKLKFLMCLTCVFILQSCKKDTAVKTLYISHNAQSAHPVHKGLLTLQEVLKEKSNGTLVVKIFPDAQLGSEREVLELLQIGSVAIAKVSAATLSNFVPEYNVLAIPYIFRDKAHKFAVLEGPVGKEILEKGSDFWLRGLCYYDAGSRSFYTKNKAIRTPDDLKGLKIRVMNDQMSINMVNALGGSATPMAYGELYTAIQQGVVDGAENNAPSFVSSNHFEVSKYYTIDEHSSIPDVMVISTKWWNTLTTQEQQWLQEAADASAIAQKDYWNASVIESMEIAKASGVEIIIPDKTLFADKTVPVMETFVEEYPALAPLVNRIKAVK